MNSFIDLTLAEGVLIIVVSPPSLFFLSMRKCVCPRGIMETGKDIIEHLPGCVLISGVSRDHKW